MLQAEAQSSSAGGVAPAQLLLQCVCARQPALRLRVLGAPSAFRGRGRRLRMSAWLRLLTTKRMMMTTGRMAAVLLETTVETPIVQV